MSTSQGIRYSETLGAWWQRQSTYELALILSFPVFLAELRHSKALLVIGIAYFAVLLAVKSLRYHTGLLFLWALGLSAYLGAYWYAAEDHVYLGVYWAWALFLICSDKGDKDSLVRFHVRILTCLTFFFATFWKLLSDDYMNGTMFSFMLLFEQRFGNTFGIWFGGMTPESLMGYGRDLAALKLTPEVSQKLIIDSRILSLGKFLSWYGVAIEGALALLFMAPRSWKVSRIAPWCLFLFCITVYGLVPVVGFGALFLVYCLLTSEGRWKPYFNTLCMACYVFVFLQFLLRGGEAEYALIGIAPLGPLLHSSPKFNMSMPENNT
jgi:hypothetical protein